MRSRDFPDEEHRKIPYPMTDRTDRICRTITAHGIGFKLLVVLSVMRSSMEAIEMRAEPETMVPVTQAGRTHLVMVSRLSVSGMADKP